VADQDGAAGRVRHIVEFAEPGEELVFFSEIKALFDRNFGRRAQGRTHGGKCFARAPCGRAQNQVGGEIARGKPFGHREGGLAAAPVQGALEIGAARVGPRRFGMAQ